MKKPFNIDGEWDIYNFYGIEVSLFCGLLFGESDEHFIELTNNGCRNGQWFIVEETGHYCKADSRVFDKHSEGFVPPKMFNSREAAHEFILGKICDVTGFTPDELNDGLSKKSSNKE